jgi:hypothetical protein
VNLGPISPPPPKDDYALKFEKDTDLIEVASLVYPGMGPVTIEAFVTPTNIETTSHIVSLNGQAGDGVVAIRLGTGHWFGLSGKNPLLDYRTAAGATVGRRFHVAVTWNGADPPTLFVDGKPNDRNLGRISKAVSQPGLSIGGNALPKRSTNGGPPGIIDEIRVSKSIRYDKEFTPATRFEPDADTLALYHFDEGEGDVLKDSSGNGHHGKIVGATWVKSDAVPVSAANPGALFVKSGDRVEFPSLPVDPRTPVTLEAFIRVTEEGKTKFFGQAYPLKVYMDRVERGYSGSGANYHVASETIGFPVGTRVHVAIEQMGKACKLYVNGRFVKQMDGQPYPEPNEQSLFSIGGGTGAFAIDSLRVSRVARYNLQTGKKSDYAIPTLPFRPDADTLALYHFDEGDGDVLKDSSGNNHHGKIVGAKWVKGDGAADAKNADK